MMPLINIQTFDQLVTNQATAQQAQSSQILDQSEGSVTLAVNESNADIAQWLQSLVIQLIAVTRLSTSTGPDVDSFIADFGCIPRLPAIPATGAAIFSRFTSSIQALIYPGATVQSADGSENYIVTTDATNSAWSPDLLAYVVPISTSSVTVPIQAVVAGSSGNMAVGSVTVITTAIPGVDTVTNATATTGGQDIEPDGAVKARFVEFIASFQEGTIAAVKYAVVQTQVGLVCNIVENYSYSNVLQLGYFYVILDDGSGAPSTTLINLVKANIEAIRPLCSSFDIFAPVIINADVAIALTLSSGNLSAIEALVQAAIIAYINSTPLGQPLAYTMLSAVAYGVSPLITNVTAITLNGGIADLIATNQQTIKAGAITIS
jgi:uncharacterized phage protein gp47/JayE